MKVLLVSPPFGLIEYPSLAVSLLKAEVERAGMACDVDYASIEFAKRVGFANYRNCYWSDPQLLISERIFAQVLFGDRIPAWGRFWQEVVMAYDAPMWARLRHPDEAASHGRAFSMLVDEAAAFVEDYSRRPELSDYDVIGFSTSYGQNLASLAIAERLKQLYPDTMVIFGGANCGGRMGQQLLLSFRFVDYVCTGDGDRSFPLFLSQLRDGQPVAAPGIFSQQDVRADELPPVAPVLVHDLDDLPFPDFRDYFEAFHFPEGELAETIAIPMETSRGCWWGEKHHCTFCGLNQDGMLYRSKSPERVGEEIRHLVTTYGIKKIMMVDNILRADFVKSLVPVLADNRVFDEIFFELKANMSRQDLEQLTRAGITHLQPGIESLSTRVLQLMDKGVDSFTNLEILKWSKELGIQVAWNLLCGFPGETQDDYDEIGELIPKIYHLMPAQGFSQITVDRFSPLFMDPERFETEIQPNRAYPYVYALPGDEIENLAYWFSHRNGAVDTSASLAVPAYARRAHQAYLVWRRLYGRVDFSYRQDGDRIRVRDTRPGAETEHRVLDALESRVFGALERRQTLSSLRRLLSDSDANGAPTEAELEAVLDRFASLSYLHSERGKFLVLANREVSRRHAGTTYGLGMGRAPETSAVAGAGS